MHQAMGSKKQRLVPLTLYALLRSPYFSCLFWFFIFGGLYLIERNPKPFQDVLPKIPPSERSKVTVAVGVLLIAEELETMGRLALQTWVASARAKGIIVKFFGAFDNEEFPVIKIVEKEEWMTLPNKTLQMFKWFWQEYGDQGCHDEEERLVDYFFKVDIDTYVVVDNLVKSLPKIRAKDLDFFGFCGYFPAAEAHMCGGSGYALGRNAVSKLVRQFPQCELKGWAEDETLAKCLDPIGLKGVDVHGFAPVSPADAATASKEQIIFHKTMAADFLPLHEVWGKLQQE